MGRQRICEVRLTSEQRTELTRIVRKLDGSPRKIMRANILLKADVSEPDGPRWCDQCIAEAVGCCVSCASMTHRRFYRDGLKIVNTRRPPNSPRARKIDEATAARILAV